MTYSETIEYLFHVAPLFQQVGGAAYKEGLTTTELLDKHFGHPHRRFRTIHVAGTNGKGSCAHTIAAALQHRGLHVGLYTSPHLVDFRERIRVGGEMMPKQAVIDFVAQERSFFEPLHPSFFELTTALAFKYFADSEVDVAVVEVGLGGRLDCTNIIRPDFCLITNISFDHTQYLGHSLADIAREKAGIIKSGVPVVIGEVLPQTRPIFQARAEEVGASITFAEDRPEVLTSTLSPENLRSYETIHFGTLQGELSGDCQVKNANTLLAAFRLLMPLFNLQHEDIAFAFRHVTSATGLQGRWQQVCARPMTICDTGHNVGGWQYLSRQLQDAVCRYPKVHVVFGMAADKDIDSVLSTLPREAKYYWTRASVHRAMSSEEVLTLASLHGLHGEAYDSVAAAYAAALASATLEDFIYVGGSSFVVADLLAILN